MNISLNILSFDFNISLNSIKTSFQNLTLQQKIISIVTIIFATINVIDMAYRYYFKAKSNHNSLNKTITEIFKKYNYDPCKLPILEKTQSHGLVVTTNCIQIEDMTSPVMRFTEPSGCKGIAFHIKGRDTSTREARSIYHLKNVPASKIDEVWFLFQMFKTDLDFWSILPGTYAQLVIRNRYDETDLDGSNTKERPSLPVILEGILTGKDPDFQLGEKADFNLFAQA